MSEGHTGPSSRRTRSTPLKLYFLCNGGGSWLYLPLGQHIHVERPNTSTLEDLTSGLFQIFPCRLRAYSGYLKHGLQWLHVVD